MRQKQGIEAATALLCALETKIQATPQTFAQILEILGYFCLSQELVAQMKEQCEARKATATQRSPAQSTHHDTGEAAATQRPPVQSTHHDTGQAAAPREATGTQSSPAQSTQQETGEEAVTHGPATPPILHQKSGTTASHKPATPILHGTRGTTVTQEATGGITQRHPAPPPIHPGMCACLCVCAFM